MKHFKIILDSKGLKHALGLPDDVEIVGIVGHPDPLAVAIHINSESYRFNSLQEADNLDYERPILPLQNVRGTDW